MPKPDEIPGFITTDTGAVVIPPAVSHVMGFFSYLHLPERLQEVSKPFHFMAISIAVRAPDSPETVEALRKLLEAKDCAVRAAL